MNFTGLAMKFLTQGSYAFDFQIKSIGWANDYVRDGDRLDDHDAYERFRPGGEYHSNIL